MSIAGYHNSWLVPINGSATAATPAGYLQSLWVSQYPDPIETGSWVVNSKTYNSRLPISVLDTTESTLTDKFHVFEIDTAWLVANGYFHASADGDEVEFTDADGSTTLSYTIDTVHTSFDSARTHYHVQFSLTALQNTTKYFYFDVDQSATSTNFFTDRSTTLFDIAASTDDCLVGTNSSIDLVRNVVAAGNAFGTVSFDSGMRFFIDGTIQSGYTIDSAVLKVTETAVDPSSTVSTPTIIDCEDADSTATFSTYADFVGRSSTTASVNWTPSPDTWVAGTTYDSPDISDCLQEVVDRAGFDGEHLTVFWRDDTIIVFAARHGSSYDDATEQNPQIEVTHSNYVLPNIENKPAIVVPRLYDADVRLDGTSDNFPTDVVFVDPVSLTQLTHYINEESRTSLKLKSMEFLVKVDAVIPQSGTTNILLLTGKPSQTTFDPFYSASDAYNYYNDFESQTTGWSDVTGTWALSSQQKPIHKGNDFAFSRAHQIIYSGGKYHMFMWGARQWIDVGYTNPDDKDGLYGWRGPHSVYKSTSTDLIHWENEFEVFLDNRAWCNTTGYMQWNANILEVDGVFYMLYTNFALTSDDYVTALGVATTTDLDVPFVASAANPIWTGGEQGSSTKSVDGFLYHESGVWYLIYRTLAGGDNNLYYATRTAATPEGPFINQGVLFDAGAYTEGWEVTKRDGTYYFFAGDIGGGFRQEIRAYSAPDITGPWTSLGRITMTTQEGTYDAQGLPRFIEVDSELKMLYFGQCQTPEAADETNIDNFLYSATESSFPLVWDIDNVSGMLLQSHTFQTESTFIYETTVYSDFRITVPLMMLYEQENAGVIVRRQPDPLSRYYIVQFDRTLNAIQLRRVFELSNVLVAQATLNFTMSPAGSLYQIDVVCYGSDIYVSYNRYGDSWTPAFNVTDTVLPNTGLIGLSADASTSYYDKVAISDAVMPAPTIGTAVWTAMGIIPIIMNHRINQGG